MALLAPTPSQRDPASFRDPAGYVFHRQGRVFRAVDGQAQDTLRHLAASGLANQLAERGWLVPSHGVDDESLLAELREEHPGYEHFLEHEPLGSITYPYEWSASMLADAALLTLDMQSALLERGFCLKDASAYNVQFVGGRPTFIDWTSFVLAPRRDVWPALGQFNAMFLYPLLLHRLRGWDLRSYFLGAPAGRTVEQVAVGLGRWALCRPDLWLDVTLPRMLGYWCERSRAARNSHKAEQTLDDPTSQRYVLRRLRRKIAGLANGRRLRSGWTSYGVQNSYEAESAEAKQRFVAEALTELAPRRVLDLGCNTGEISYLAAGCGGKVLAVDADHDCVDALYRRLRQTPADITPLVIDLTSPSPGIGYRNLERPPFGPRAQADCVLALALVHHLHIQGNLPWAAIRDQLAELTRDAVMVEHVPPDDPMFRRLLRFREPPREDASVEHFRSVFAQRFELVREERLLGSGRTLFLFRRVKESA